MKLKELARNLPIIIAVFALSFLFSLFSSQASANERISIQLKWFHQFQFAGYYAAKELGYFAEEGLDVELREYDETRDPIEEVISDRADYGIADTGLVLSRLNGKPVVLVSQIFQHSPLILIAMKGSGLRTPFDLADKRLMTYLQGSGDAPLRAMVQKALGSHDKATWVQHSFNNQDLIDGKVDAMLAYSTNEPYWFLEQGKLVNLLDPRDYGIDFYSDNLFTSDQNLADHPDQIARVRRAVLKGWKRALEQPDQIIDLILKKYNTQNKSRAYLTFEAQQIAELIDLRNFDLGYYEASRFQKIAETYQRLDLTKQSTVPQGFFADNQDLLKEQSTTGILLTEEERSWITEHPVFRVAATPDWPPFEMRKEDGAYAGISADFIRLAAKKAGLDTEIHFDKWRPLIDSLKKRELDVAPGLNETDDRKKFLTFTNFFVEQYSVIFTSNDRKDIQTMENLDGKTVVVEKGYALSEVLARDYPKIKLLTVANSFEAIQKVSLKEADAYVGNQVVASYLTKKNMITNVRAAGFFPGKHGLLRFGIRSDWPILRNILGKGLAAISSDERNAILSTYIDVDQGLRQKTVSLTDEERSWVAANPVIRLAGDPVFPPLEFRNADGTMKGYTTDLLAIAAKRIGITIETVITFDRMDAEQKVRSGRAEILGVSVKADKVPEGLLQTEAYQTFPSVIIVPSSSQSGNVNLDLLRDKKVGVVAGWPEEAYIREHYPDIDLQTVPDNETGLNKLAFGNFEAFVTLLPTASHVIQEQGITSLRIGGRLPITFSYAFAVRADNLILARLLDKAIASISQKEEKELLARWISLTVQEGLDLWTVLIWGGGVGGGALVIIALVIAWNRRLGAEILQRKIVEAKLSEAMGHIEGSIQYASRIQRAILPDMTAIESRFSDHFVLWEPRDVVGGDIYWSVGWGDGLVILLGDCTGHGVPGAFMTLITTGALDRAVTEIPVGDLPALIKRTHQLVQSTLGQDQADGESDDGMELGAFYLKNGEDKMTFVGARFGLFLVMDGEVSEIKSTKKGIGYRGIPFDQDYKLIEVDLVPDLCFYISSDGLIDQIGGERKRMFGKKRFKGLLTSIQDKSMTEQKETIYQALLDYQGDENRRDDVSVIGFKF